MLYNRTKKTSSKSHENNSVTNITQLSNECSAQTKTLPSSVCYETTPTGTKISQPYITWQSYYWKENYIYIFLDMCKIIYFIFICKYILVASLYTIWTLMFATWLVNGMKLTGYWRYFISHTGIFRSSSVDIWHKK